ncbi:MAG TPA: periplasmic heavy metal sensor [Candidatus Eremiobacteraceae bacterium]|nr:periplasmic heavy metal sensor [Candidatus Eremiobacteraceae bacterium]
MRNLIPAIFAVAVISLPLGAVAGDQPAPMPPMPPMPPPGMGMAFDFDGQNLTPAQQQQIHQIMDQTHQQMDQLMSQARSRVLGSITPAHRQLLAQIVGNLAISQNPDWDGAAKQLNAALSPGEAQAVLSAHQAAMQQMMSLMQSTHQRMESVLTTQQRSQMQNGHPNDSTHDRMYFKGPAGSPTAGEILLHLSEGGFGDHMFIEQHVQTSTITH